jgi:hypothetical protein
MTTYSRFAHTQHLNVSVVCLDLQIKNFKEMQTSLNESIDRLMEGAASAEHTIRRTTNATLDAISASFPHVRHSSIPLLPFHPSLCIQPNPNPNPRIETIASNKILASIRIIFFTDFPRTRASQRSHNPQTIRRRS